MPAPLNPRLQKLEETHSAGGPNSVNRLLWEVHRRYQPELKLPEEPPAGSYDNTNYL